MSDKTSLNYLIRWAGFIILALIFSVTGYCSADSFLSAESGCEREVRKIVEKCYQEAGISNDEADAACRESAEIMIQSCNGVNHQTHP